MRNLFSKRGLTRLREFCVARGTVVCAFDFDGTLAPIVSRPEDARMKPEVEAALRRLAGLCRVIVISGRSVRDLRTRMPLEDVILVGNHGSESPFVTEQQRADSRRASDSWKEGLRPRMGTLPGVCLEDKTFSLALHYRHSPRHGLAREEILSLVGTLSPPPRLVAGKEVINLVHPDLPHKGDALESFRAALAGPRCVYLGDDVTDEDVFALPGEDVFKIRVAKSRDTQAHWFLPRQRDIRRVLDCLVEFLEEQARRPALVDEAAPSGPPPVDPPGESKGHA